MCGICGIVRFGGATEQDREDVREVTRALSHRGPDGEGFWSDDQAVFGHARLAIIDLATGDQPMSNRAGNICVIFNGEIYNYVELRDELRAAGRTLRTRSDTEVLVEGYEQWGIDELLRRLRGMFAFALWDAREHRLLLARDRLGEKPLYYRMLKGGGICFASEIKAVIAQPDAPRSLNERRLAEYLAYRCVAGTETLFEGVLEVAPGAVMTLTPGRTMSRQYWELSTSIGAARFDEALLERGESLLAEAVRYRLVSDVPLGTITSGGLDSSLTTAIAVKVAGRPLDTFCVGFPDPSFDERPFGREVARHVGSTHHEIVVSTDDMSREYERLTWAHDEPLTHPNSIPMHLIFRYAKEQAGVTVVLSGEGADELFGGYSWYANMRRRRMLRAVPGVGAALSVAPWKKARVVRKLLAPDYPRTANAVLERDIVRRLLPGAPDYAADREAFWPSGLSDIDALFRYDQQVYLPPLLQRQDRMAMAAGVEARVVFLDHFLVEWANSLSASVKLRGGVRKALLKRIGERWIPRSIVYRPKVGFTVPLADWLRATGPFGQRVAALREPGAFVRSLVDTRTLDQLLREHESAQADHSDAIWTLTALETWAETFLGSKLPRYQLPGSTTGRRLSSVAGRDA